MKQWKYIKGSEKDFEGAQDWVTCVSQGTHSKVFYDQVIGKGRWKNKAFGNEGYDSTGGLPIIAQRELIEVWNGEGLPPVGTVCEYNDGNTWIPVEIVFLSKWVIVIRSKANNIGNGVDIAKDLVLNIPPEFRPLPTERDLAIEQLFYDLPEDMRPGKDVREALYDAGYRKYSAKPGFEWRYVCSTCGCKVEPGEELPHGC